MGKTPEQNETSGEGNKGKNFLETLYPILDLFLRLDDQVKAHLEENPGLAKAVYLQSHEIGKDFQLKESEIDEQKLMDEMTVEARAFLLFGEYFSDKEGLVSLASIEQCRSLYRLADRFKPEFNAVEFSDYPHMVVPLDTSRGNFEQVMQTFKGLTSSKAQVEGDLEKSKDLRSFSLPLGGRFVLGTRFAPYMIPSLQAEAKRTDKKLTVLYPGEVSGPPSEDECQLILSTSPMESGSKLDWGVVEDYKEIWEDQTVPAFGWGRDIVAAIYVLKGQSPEEACKTAGISKSDPKFLAALKTAPDLSDPDDLGEAV